MFKNIGGTITGWNFLAWDFLGGGGGEFSRGDLMGGNFLGVHFSEGGDFPDTIFIVR